MQQKIKQDSNIHDFVIFDPEYLIQVAVSVIVTKDRKQLFCTSVETCIAFEKQKLGNLINMK